MSMHQIRVGIAGVGNCTSSLVQAVDAASEISSGARQPGVISARIGAYEPRHLCFSCAFDVDRNKVGLDLSQAIFVAPSCARRHRTPPPSGIVVRPGVLEDGLDGALRDHIQPHEATLEMSLDSVAEALRATSTEVLICYLPTGATRAVQSYAAAAASAGVAFVNATPEPVANDLRLQQRFREAGAPLLGDDIRSQLGATAIHAALVDLCARRAARVDRSYQLNFGGNMDFLNLADPGRSESKRRTKRRALEAAGADSETSLFAGPAGHIPFLEDEKVAYIRLSGELLLGMPFSVEVRLQVEDSPNSAGIALEALRLARVAADIGHAGALLEPAPFLFKSPPRMMDEAASWAAYQRFLAQLDEDGASTDHASSAEERGETRARSEGSG